MTEGAEATIATVTPDINAETLQKREQALGADLLWLLHQGHVIDFAMGNLQAATRPAPKQLSKKEAAAAAAATAGATPAPAAESDSLDSSEGNEGMEGVSEDSGEEIVVSEEAPARDVATATASVEELPSAEHLPEQLAEPAKE